jgi:hypothetical protein
MRRIISETEARASVICVGCDRRTDCEGGFVCWGCFKYRCPKHPIPFKYAGIEFEQWQAQFTK